jgi:hypothetical protein
MIDILGDVTDSFRQGMRKIQDVYQIERDRNIQIYNKLKPQDFEVLEQRFGPDQTMNYIRTMEARRMRQR